MPTFLSPTEAVTPDQYPTTKASTFYIMFSNAEEHILPREPQESSVVPITHTP